MFRHLKDDVQAFFQKDPAATSVLEILFCYPGLHAILTHRLAHYLYTHKVPLIPRFLSHFSRLLTGIEIHPGAKIGKRMVIDHGMGVVIGETAEVGDDVLLYQGVTLGGTGKEKGKRHPTLGNNIVVGAHATVLGPITIGDNVKIGAGSVVVRSVPPNTTVVGVPGRVVALEGRRISTLDILEHGELPDPEAEAIKCLMGRIRELEQKVEHLADADKDTVLEKRFVKGAGI
jgi:serine O-acetyltransferase